MLHKTLFMAVWLFFLFFLLFPLSFPLSLIPLSLNINLLFDFPTSISKHVPKQLHWVIRSFKSMRIRTVCWFLWGSRSPNRERSLQTTAGHAKFKLYPYKSTFEIAIKIKIKREKYMEDRVCTLHLIFSFLPQWFSILCLKWGLHIQQPKREQ